MILKSIVKQPLLFVCILGINLLNPPMASADTLGPFIDYLDNNGVNVSSTEAQDADVELGQAICGLYAAALKVGKNPNHDVMTQLEARHTQDSAAMWLVGSVNYVCPQYLSLLPCQLTLDRSGGRTIEPRTRKCPA
ncbi:MAG: hypothetical protein QOK02_5657 [Mycobacterium sp.]|jgi:hypothetical protein|nr:hypothetical protein [Mycobacterium sp.]